MSQVADIETNILALALAAGHSKGGPLAYDFSTLEVYPEDWEGRLTAKPFVAPGIFVTFAGYQPSASFGSGVRLEASFGVAVVAQSKRDKTTPRHGGPTPEETGSLDLQEDMAGLLQGSDLGLGIGGLTLTAGEFAVASDAMVKAGLSIFAMRFTTSITIEAKPFTPSSEFVDDFLKASGSIDLGGDDVIERQTLNTFTPQEP